MPYHVQLLERDENYLATCSDIADARRDEIRARCEEGLANISDEARCDPIDRIAPNRFRYVYVFRGEDGVGRTLRFIVDESAMSYSVLRVLYVDVIEGKQIRRLDAPPSNTG
ncbi:MAG TPA: hypothetical protein VMF69_05820 [Gemmataceae bacterium]|nr:hypothetical protein [Gemmataceae bacterium]